MIARTRTTQVARVRVLRALLLAALFPLLAGVSAAQEGDAFDEIRYSRPGYYLGGSALAAFPTGSRDLDNTFGFDVRFGNRITRWWALEAYGVWLHDFHDDDENVSLNVWSVGLAGRVYPLSGRIQPYLSAGLGFLQSREHGDGSANQSSGIGPRAGLGVDLYVRSGLAVTLDSTVVIPVGQPRDVDHVRIGLGFQWF